MEVIPTPIEFDTGNLSHSSGSSGVNRKRPSVVARHLTSQRWISPESEKPHVKLLSLPFTATSLCNIFPLSASPTLVCALEIYSQFRDYSAKD